MEILKLLAPVVGKDGRFDEPGPAVPNIASKLLLATCLLDRAKSAASGITEPSAGFDDCRTMLNEIRRRWRYCEENGSTAAVDATYKIYVLMSAIERLMGRLPTETGGYTCLQQCINLLDEVDLTLEKFAVLQTANE